MSSNTLEVSVSSLPDAIVAAEVDASRTAMLNVIEDSSMCQLPGDCSPYIAEVTYELLGEAFALRQSSTRLFGPVQAERLVFKYERFFLPIDLTFSNIRNISSDDEILSLAANALTATVGFYKLLLGAPPEQTNSPPYLNRAMDYNLEHNEIEYLVLGDLAMNAMADFHVNLDSLRTDLSSNGSGNSTKLSISKKLFDRWRRSNIGKITDRRYADRLIGRMITDVMDVISGPEKKVESPLHLYSAHLFTERRNTYFLNH